MSKKNVYLSEKGSDSTGDGSKERPYASLPVAVRNACGGTVYICGGTYFLQEPVVLQREDSGLTLCALPGEAVVLSGALPLENLTWTPSKENPKIYETKLRPGLNIDALFAGGKRQVLARYPNRREGAVPLEGAATKAEIKERAKGYQNPKGGYLRAIHEAGWGGNSYCIDGKDDGNALGLSYHWVGDNNRGSGMRDEIVIENVREELDAPQEWYYDNETGLLSFYPGEEAELTQGFEAAVNAELFQIRGESPQAPVKNITLRGLTLNKTKRTMFTIDEPGKAYVPLLRGDWCVVRAGAVTAQNARGIQIKDCSFYEIGGNAVFFSGYQEANCVANCEFRSIGATAIQIAGLPQAVWEPSFWPHALYPDLQVHKTTVEHVENRGPKTEDYPRDILIENNHMECLGVFEKQSSGVNLSISKNVKIRHNTIHNSARSNININDGTFGGHEIAYNDIFDAQRETQDHGPFNSWGRDRFWSVPKYNAGGLYGERLRHYPSGKAGVDITQLDAVETTKIHNNRFHHSYGAPHSWGIDLDDGSSNYEIYENLCLGLGIKLREGFNRRVYNNLLVGGELQIHVPYAGAGDDIYSNLIVSKTPVCFAAVSKKRFQKAGIRLHENGYYCPDVSVKLPRWFASRMPGSRVDTGSVTDEDPKFLAPEENDYTVDNTQLMEKTGFHNFSMVNFGKPDCPASAPVYQFRGSGCEEEAGERFLGAVISNVNEAVMSSTACSGTNGVYFVQVPRLSAAYRLGFRERDVVKLWAGIPLRNIADFRERIGLAVNGSVAELGVHRQNMLCTLRCKLNTMVKMLVRTGR